MKKLKLDELNRLSIDDFKNLKKTPVIIVLDNIRSMYNVGSIFRTSDAFSVSELFLCGITGTPPHKELRKTALGATESVNWRYFEKTTEGIDWLKKNGYTVYAVEQTDASINLFNFSPSHKTKIAFIFGNEVDGVSDEVIEMVDAAIEIPQLGTKHSFNVATTVGIVLWDYFYKTKKRG